MTSIRRAIVVGGGIGGPVAALALQRAGIGAPLRESPPPADADEGGFLTLASNGLDALRGLGLLEAIAPLGFPTPRMVMWSATGKRLGEVLGGLSPEPGLSSTTVLRGALSRALRSEAVRRGIP